MVESVRPAGPEDATRCDELFDAARRQAANQRGGSQLLGTEGPGFATAADRQVLLGELDGMAVGIAAGWVDRGGGRTVGQVACCYVEPEAREVGLGSALLSELLAWFTDVGCEAVDAPALPGDRSTKQLLERSGFRARLLVLHRPLR